MSRTYHKALIIDDDVDLCMLLKAILSDTISEVTFTHSLEEGKNYLESSNPDIVFLDNNLPDGPGVDHIAAIKSIKPGIALVVITAADNYKERAIESGADVFIAKPLTRNNIQAVLQNFDAA